MKIRHFGMIIAALLAGSALAEKPVRQAQDRPNIIFINADDIGGHSLR